MSDVSFMNYEKNAKITAVYQDSEHNHFLYYEKDFYCPKCGEWLGACWYDRKGNLLKNSKIESDISNGFRKPCKNCE